MTQDVSEATIVNAAVLPTIAHQSFLYSRALLNDDLFLHRFLSSPNRDLYSLLDDDLKYKLEYAWTLPLNSVLYSAPRIPAGIAPESAGMAPESGHSCGIAPDSGHSCGIAPE